MSDPSNAARLQIVVDAGQEATADDLDRLTRELGGELQDLEVESVELVKAGDAPPGTKSVEVLALGSLWIGILPSMIPKLIEFLQSWSMRGQDRTVKIKANVGDRAVEVEYSPRVTSEAEMKSMVETITSALAQKPAATDSPG